MNYHGNLTAPGKSHCMRSCIPSVYLFMSNCDFSWSRQCLSSANAVKFSTYLCVASLTNFLTAMGLYVFRQLKAIYSFIYRSKCQNILFEKVPKVGAIHKNKDVFNGIWRNWSLRNNFGPGSECPCLALVQHLTPSVILVSLYLMKVKSIMHL